ncbi:MAG: dihydrofolate reductase family protein, partial [bacterium]|nr:dihydrofolate reductase family protein [bacterium]
ASVVPPPRTILRGVTKVPPASLVAIEPESAWDDHRFRDSVESENVELIECPVVAGHIDISYLLKSLVDRNIYSVLVEGGSGIHASFLNKGFADEILCVVAPKIFGGNTAPSPVSGSGIDEVNDAAILDDVKYVNVDDDVMIFGKVKTK